MAGSPLYLCRQHGRCSVSTTHAAQVPAPCKWSKAGCGTPPRRISPATAWGAALVPLIQVPLRVDRVGREGGNNRLWEGPRGWSEVFLIRQRSVRCLLEGRPPANKKGGTAHPPEGGRPSH